MLAVDKDLMQATLEVDGRPVLDAGRFVLAVD